MTHMRVSFKWVVSHWCALPRGLLASANSLKTHRADSADARKEGRPMRCARCSGDITRHVPESCKQDPRHMSQQDMHTLSSCTPGHIKCSTACSSNGLRTMHYSPEPSGRRESCNDCRTCDGVRTPTPPKILLEAAQRFPRCAYTRSCQQSGLRCSTWLQSDSTADDHHTC